MKLKYLFLSKYIILSFIFLMLVTANAYGETTLKDIFSIPPGQIDIKTNDPDEIKSALQAALNATDINGKTDIASTILSNLLDRLKRSRIGIFTTTYGTQVSKETLSNFINIVENIENFSDIKGIEIEETVNPGSKQDQQDYFQEGDEPDEDQGPMTFTLEFQDWINFLKTYNEQHEDRGIPGNYYVLNPVKICNDFVTAQGATALTVKLQKPPVEEQEPAVTGTGEQQAAITSSGEQQTLVPTQTTEQAQAPEQAQTPEQAQDSSTQAISAPNTSVQQVAVPAAEAQIAAPSASGGQGAETPSEAEAPSEAAPSSDSGDQGAEAPSEAEAGPSEAAPSSDLGDQEAEAPSEATPSSDSGNQEAEAPTEAEAPSKAEVSSKAEAAGPSEEAPSEAEATPIPSVSTQKAATTPSIGQKTITPYSSKSQTAVSEDITGSEPSSQDADMQQEEAEMEHIAAASYSNEQEIAPQEIKEKTSTQKKTTKAKKHKNVTKGKKQTTKPKTAVKKTKPKTAAEKAKLKKAEEAKKQKELKTEKAKASAEMAKKQQVIAPQAIVQQPVIQKPAPLQQPVIQQPKIPQVIQQVAIQQPVIQKPAPILQPAATQPKPVIQQPTIKQQTIAQQIAIEQQAAIQKTKELQAAEQKAKEAEEVKEKQAKEAAKKKELEEEEKEKQAEEEIKKSWDELSEKTHTPESLAADLKDDKFDKEYLQNTDGSKTVFESIKNFCSSLEKQNDTTVTALKDLFTNVKAKKFFNDSQEQSLTELETLVNLWDEYLKPIYTTGEIEISFGKPEQKSKIWDSPPTVAAKQEQFDSAVKTEIQSKKIDLDGNLTALNNAKNLSLLKKLIPEKIISTYTLNKIHQTLINVCEKEYKNPLKAEIEFAL